MSVKNLLIIAAAILLIISAVSVAFFREVTKEAAPILSVPIAGQVAMEKTRAPYTIPANTTPSVAEIEASIKKSKVERAENDKVTAQLRAAGDAAREEIRAQLEASATAPQDTVEIAKKAAAQDRERKMATPPTKEQRAEMQTRNVVAY